MHVLEHFVTLHRERLTALAWVGFRVLRPRGLRISMSAPKQWLARIATTTYAGRCRLRHDIVQSRLRQASSRGGVMSVKAVGLSSWLL
jgi:predicted SAM-dependent methyltransferase